MGEEDGYGGECDGEGQGAEASLQGVCGEGEYEGEREVDGQINGEAAFAEGLECLLGGQAVAWRQGGEE